MCPGEKWRKPELSLGQNMYVSVMVRGHFCVLHISASGPRAVLVYFAPSQLASAVVLVWPIRIFIPFS